MLDLEKLNAEHPDMEIEAEGTLKRYHGTAETVVVPEGIVKIGDSVFGKNTAVKEVLLPATLTEIGHSAFDKSSLERITIPAGVRKIGFWAFRDCHALAEIKLPDGLEEIGMYAFSYCQALKAITLPRGLRTIGRQAFEHSAVEELELAEGMVSIGERAFERMKSLHTVRLPSTLSCIGTAAFEYCTQLAQVNLPQGLLQIRRYAFGDCDRLEKVELPDSLIELEPFAFSGTPFEKTTDLKALAEKINKTVVFPMPEGFRGMEFGSCLLQVPSGEVDYDPHGGGTQRFEKLGLEYVRDITADISVFRTAAGRDAVMLYHEVPTFDSSDREWDSYRKLYLLPDGDRIEGYQVAGGYHIAKITYYPDIRLGNERTRKLLKLTGIF